MRRRKRELVYRKLLLKPETTQLELAKILGISLSTVNSAIEPLRRMGAVEVRLRRLKVVDKEKLLLFWASMRILRVLYMTRAEMPVGQIEKSMPPGVLFTAYTGYRFRYRDVPADYSEVYVYAQGDALEAIKARFPESAKAPNIFVLEPDEHLFKVSRKSIVPDEQLFADLWNLPEWYAKEFVTRLKERIL